jgi:hypothetical protein
MLFSRDHHSNRFSRKSAVGREEQSQENIWCRNDHHTHTILRQDVVVTDQPPNIDHDFYFFSNFSSDGCPRMLVEYPDGRLGEFERTQQRCRYLQGGANRHELTP